MVAVLSNCSQDQGGGEPGIDEDDLRTERLEKRKRFRAVIDQIVEGGNPLAIQEAIQKENSSSLDKKALKASLENNNPTMTGWLLDHYAKKRGKEALKKLINSTGKDKRTYLQKAVSRGDTQGAKQLIAAGADLFVRTPITEPSPGEKIPAKPTQPWYGPPGRGLIPLHLAICKKDEAMVKAIIEEAKKQGISLKELLNARSTKGEVTPLHMAVTGGVSTIAQILLENGADVNAVFTDYYMPKVEDYSLDDLTVDPSAPDSKFSSLLWATMHNDEPMVDVLLKFGAKADMVSGDGYTALHFAAAHDNLSLMKKLLAKDTSAVNIADSTGATPIFYGLRMAVTRYLRLAVGAKKPENWEAIANLLLPHIPRNKLKEYLSIGLMTVSGRFARRETTLYHMLAKEESVSNVIPILQWVEKNGGIQDIDKRDRRNRTSLMAAIQRYNGNIPPLPDSLAFIKFLIKNGANPGLTNDEGKDCIQMAQERNASPELLNLLQSGGE